VKFDRFCNVTCHLNKQKKMDDDNARTSHQHDSQDTTSLIEQQYQEDDVVDEIFSNASAHRGNKKEFRYDYTASNAHIRRQQFISAVLMAAFLIILVVGIFVGGGFAIQRIVKRFRKTIKVDDRPIVILMGISGFRRDFLEIFPCPNLNTLAKRGVHAERLIPQFPSATYPNLMSIVTGLYPESHGIVDSMMYDSKKKWFYNTTAHRLNPYWYNSAGPNADQSIEPIWATASKNNITTASVSWFGSNVPMGGILPKYYEQSYDRYTPISDRINRVLQYLDQKDRPQLITVFFEHVDENAHRFGLESKEVEQAIDQIDDALQVLLEGIEQRSHLMSNIHLLIVSEHGSEPVLADVPLDTITDYFTPKFPGVKAIPGMNYPFNNLFNDLDTMDNATDDDTHVSVATLYESLMDEEFNSKFKVYLKEDIPDEYNYKNHHRIAPLVMIAEYGYVFSPSSKQPSTDKSTHGYDPSHIQMGGIFIGTGRTLKSGLESPAFSNIHLYSLMCHILKIEPAPNNGTLEEISHILR
jgi:predicted AlkP superfamily pyrophosphatase or phosphodiesterase